MKMDPLKLYQYPKCSTCKAALQFLSERGLRFEVVDISKTPPSPDELRRMIALTGAIRPLFNTSGRSYREGRFSEKLEGMSIEAAIDALTRDGMLVKRPFLLGQELGLLGFKIDEWQKLTAG